MFYFWVYFTNCLCERQTTVKAIKSKNKSTEKNILKIEFGEDFLDQRNLDQETKENVDDQRKCRILNMRIAFVCEEILSGKGKSILQRKYTCQTSGQGWL